MRKEKVLHNAVVCYLFKEDKILLAMKSQKIGKGCWNGYGGEIEEKDISPERATLREVYEETGKGVTVSPIGLKKVAIIDFHNHKSDGTMFVCRVHFFFSDRWFGELKETEEMVIPTFFNKDNIPFGQMMPADRHFLPILLGGNKIIAEYCYSPFQKSLIGESVIQYVDSFL